MFIILFKTAVAIIAALVAARTQPIQPRASISRGAGFLLGHFIGWLVGGILGGRLGGWLLAIIGILAGAVLIGQVGAKISYALALQLERLFPSGEQAG